MKRRAKPFCCALLGWFIMMLPAAVRAESAVPLYDKTKGIFEQIQDLELMQRNVEECYQAEKQISMVARLSRQSWRDHQELDGKLMNRVFGHFAGTPEYDRFVREYRTLLKSPGYRRLHTDKLFAEYMRFLESARARLMTQWKDLQESLPENGSDQPYAGFGNAFQEVPAGYPERTKTTNNRRVGPIKREEMQVALRDSTPWAVSEKSVSRIVAHETDRSGSPSTADPTIDMVEPDILVAPERVVLQEKVSLGYQHGLVPEVRSGTRPNLRLPGAVEKGVGPRDR
jgi:hypothetical protein